MPSCEGGSHIEGNFQASTISIKPSVLDYHREQVAVKDKERESERKWGERWQMAAESDVSRRKEEHNRGETLRREMRLHYNLKRFISISHHRAVATKH